jgi:hypothetical protein
MKKAFIFIVITCSMSCCSIPGYLYLRNYSRQPVSLFILKNKYSDKYLSSVGDRLSYDSVIRPVKINLYKKLTGKILPVSNSGRVVEYILPPHSTVFLGGGLNGRIVFADGFVIKKGGSSDTIRASDFYGKYIFASGTQACYDVK